MTIHEAPIPTQAKIDSILNDKTLNHILIPMDVVGAFIKLYLEETKADTQIRNGCRLFFTREGILVVSAQETIN